VKRVSTSRSRFLDLLQDASLLDWLSNVGYQIVRDLKLHSISQKTSISWRRWWNRRTDALMDKAREQYKYCQIGFGVSVAPIGLLMLAHHLKVRRMKKGSARLSGAGFGVAPKQAFPLAWQQLKFSCDYH
jgi:hypothetical protein